MAKKTNLEKADELFWAKLQGDWTNNVSIDDVAQSEYRDYSIKTNTVIFKTPPARDHKLVIEIIG